MSIQTNILQFYIRLHYFFFILFGLWPYNLKKSFFFYYIYAIIVGALINYSNPTCAMFLVRHFNTYKTSSVYTKFQFFVVIMQVSVLVVISFYQIIYMHKHIKLALKFLQFFQKIKLTFNNIKHHQPLNIIKPLIIYAISFYLVNCLKTYGNYGRYKFQSKLDDNINFQIAIILLINFIISFLPCYICAGMLLSTFCFTQINLNIKNTLNQAKYISMDLLRNGKHKKQMTMQQYCDLTDKLETMAIFHFQLSKLTVKFVALCSIQFTVYTCWKLLTSIFQIFTIYSTLSNNKKLHKRVLWLIMANVMAISADFIILIVTTYVCAAVTKEVK